jgi:hypothetical protein
MNVKGSNLLVLKGVYPGNFAPVDYIYEKNKTFEPKAIEPSVVYTEMPKKFTSVENWPKYSNLKCWECDRIPSSYPKFIPTNLEKDKDGHEICDPYGHFDEWNCAIRFITKEMPKDQQWDLLQSVCLFESKFSGKRREKIMPSPPKYLMKAYCGQRGITLKQYNDKISQLNNDYDLTCWRLDQFKEV